jgi:hypothetical protein
VTPLIYDRVTRMTSSERWVSLMLGITAANIAGELLHQMIFADTAERIYASVRDAVLFSTSAVR